MLCLQETKVADAQFPQMAFLAEGYTITAHGQAGYNGVATLSKNPPDEVRRGFPGDPVPDQARTLWTRFGDTWVGNLYVVNGKSIHDPAYDIKLRWLDALADAVNALADEGEVLLTGDWNIAPDDRDVWDPAGWGDGILCSPQERRRLRRLLDERFTDLHRIKDGGPGPFTWWDYRGLALARDEGLRIDLALGTQGIVERVEAVTVDRHERKQGTWASKPSDHAPLIVDLTGHLPLPDVP